MRIVSVLRANVHGDQGAHLLCLLLSEQDDDRGLVGLDQLTLVQGEVVGGVAGGELGQQHLPLWSLVHHHCSALPDTSPPSAGCAPSSRPALLGHCSP